jgi:tetratricopeptide (TPR) repeat protein
VAIDREATLKQADKLVRQGKLDGAIAEYVRLIDEYPTDWNAINALGDLYLKAGNSDKALEQYIRIADHQFSEGFFPKAAALYKKALKLQAGHEHILLQLASVGERQGKFVDAKQYLKQVAKQREDRGEPRAAAECILRLGSMPEADVESRIAGAHAAQQIGDGFRAVELLKQAAQTLEKEKKRHEALQLLAEAADIDPFDTELRIRLAREFLSAGHLKQARVYLNFETAGDDVELLMALAMLEFADGREEDARVAVGRVLALAPDREPDIVKLADDLLAKARIESAYACVDAITDAALLQGDAAAAAAALQKFVTASPYQPAVAKLAHIAEDLVRNDPASDAHADLLRQAFTLSGIPDADAAVTRVRAGQSAIESAHAPSIEAPSSDDLSPAATEAHVDTPEELPEVDVFVYPENETPRAPQIDIEDIPMMPPSTSMEVPDPPLADEVGTVMLEMAEIDLSTALTALMSSAPAPPLSAPATTAPVEAPPAAPLITEPPAVIDEPTPDIEDVFAQMRAKTAREQQASAALKHYEEGLQFVEQGLDKEAITALEAAARVPMLRFKAAARLGRLLIDRGDLNEGVEWLERAAEAPAPSPEEGYDLLYELAGALEAQGESARALAILIELEAEANGYRDVSTRIMYLSRVQQTESHRS